MKFFKVLVPLFLVFGSLFAQKDSSSKIHIGFVYPLSTNGQYAQYYSNQSSFHLLAGVSRKEQSFCLSGLASFVLDTSDACLISGMLNHVGKHATGLQLAGCSNIIGGTAWGTQVAGFNNLILGSAKGLQIAGFSNISLGQTWGCQMAGFSNISGSFLGTQIAGFSNVSKDLSGLQIAGFANIAQQVRGTQIAGVINVAKKVSGVQIAGLINIADSSAYPIGLVNIIRQGEQYLGLSIEETGSTIAALRSGSKRTYGILGIGFNTMQAKLRYGLEGGLGIHFPINLLFRFNTELSVLSLTDFKNGVYMKSSLRAFPSMKIGKSLELFAGPSFSFSNYEQKLGDELNLHYVWQKRSKGTFYGLNIGGIAGIQLRL